MNMNQDDAFSEVETNINAYATAEPVGEFSPTEVIEKEEPEVNSEMQDAAAVSKKDESFESGDSSSSGSSSEDSKSQQMAEENHEFKVP